MKTISALDQKVATLVCLFSIPYSLQIAITASSMTAFFSGKPHTIYWINVIAKESTRTPISVPARVQARHTHTRTHTLLNPFAHTSMTRNPAQLIRQAWNRSRRRRPSCAPSSCDARDDTLHPTYFCSCIRQLDTTEAQRA